MESEIIKKNEGFQALGIFGAKIFLISISAARVHIKLLSFVINAQ